MGAFLAGRPRAEFVISTKVGRLPIDDPGAVDGSTDSSGLHDVPASGTTADGVLRSVEESLGRLGVYRVDLLLIHDPEDHLEQALTQACPALERLRDQGVVTGIGVGTNFVGVAETFVQHTDVDQVMIAGQHTLLDRSAEAGLLADCAQRGIAVLVAGVFKLWAELDELARAGSDVSR